MVQVPTTTPSTGYRNNILHISYCAAGVSRQGRRPEVIPAVSSFFPFSYPSYFISSFFSLTFSSPLSLRLISVTPHTPLLFPRLSLLTPVPTPFSSLTLSSPSLFCLLSVTPLPSPPRHPSILLSGLVSFPASNAPSPAEIPRTCRSFRPKCHRSRNNPSD